MGNPVITVTLTSVVTVTLALLLVGVLVGAADNRNKWKTLPERLTVRIVGGPNKREGTVEVTYKGQTGVICDDRWSIEDAHVACRMAGYGGATAFKTGNFYRYKSDNKNIVLFDEMECTLHDEDLLNCDHNNFREHDCSIAEAAGVVCGDSTTDLMKLECQHGDGTDYMGKVSWTKGGHTCQRWDTNYPADHSWLMHPWKYPDGRYPENYCRRVKGDAAQIWCYTARGSPRWEECNIPRCPSKIFFTCHKFMDKCYALIKSDYMSVTWHEAKGVCRRSGMKMAETTTQDEISFVKQLALQYGGSSYFWIGASKSSRRATYKWVSTNEEVRQWDWAPGEPNQNEFNNNAKCVHLWPSNGMRWADFECYSRHGVVCEKPWKE